MKVLQERRKINECLNYIKFRYRENFTDVYERADNYNASSPVQVVHT